MGTRLNPLAGRYFNDPSFASSVSQLAAAFMPPSAQEQYAWTKAANEQATGERLADLWAAAGDDFDRMGVAAGQWNPNQSYYAVDTADATTRRGQDLTAETSRANNAADNARAIEAAKIAGLFDIADTTLDHGQAMPGLPEDVAAALGMPSFPSQTGADLGAPAPLPSEDQVEAQLLMQAITDGLFGPGDMVTERKSDVPVETVLTPDGPRIVSRSDAVGQEPFVNTGAPPKPTLETYLTPDGRTGTAVYDVQLEKWLDTQTSAELPPGTVTGKISDTSEGFGATKSNITKGNEAIAEADYGLSRLAEFRTLLQENPGIMGIPGRVRGFAQDIVAAADEAGAAFGTIDSLDELRALSSKVGASGRYDPNIAAANALALEMAYLQAKMQDPGGEVNVRELERLLGVFDGGIAGNPKVLSALSVLEDQLNTRKTYGAQLRGETAGPAETGSGPLEITGDEEYDALPPGTEFIGPDGIKRRKP